MNREQTGRSTNSLDNPRFVLCALRKDDAVAERRKRSARTNRTLIAASYDEERTA